MKVSSTFSKVASGAHAGTQQSGSGGERKSKRSDARNGRQTVLSAAEFTLTRAEPWWVRAKPDDSVNKNIFYILEGVIYEMRELWQE